MKSKIKETKQSFEYQWKNLPEGKWLLSDPRWRENVDKFILQELDNPRKWFKGKKVLDAGCGNGRWSYGFLKLGCSVTAFDVSPSGCQWTRRNTKKFKKRIKVFQSDIFELAKTPLKKNSFDIIYSWGVLHHTYDTFEAFKKLVPFVKKGGVFHVYIYGINKKIHSNFIHFILHTFFGFFSLSKRHALSKIIGRLWGKSPHSLFDAYSARIRHHHSPEEVKSWFILCGFKEVKRTFPEWCGGKKNTRDSHMFGVK